MSDRLCGYHGRMLVVDLTRQAWRLEPLPTDMLRSVMGGTGLATRLLYDLTPPQADPLGPDNALLFVGSPLVGTPLTTTSKFTVAARSPLTGFIGDSLSSSHLALELKRCGCDAVVFLGAAARWSMVAISWLGPQEAQPTVRFLDAADLMGYDTAPTAAGRAGASWAEAGGLLRLVRPVSRWCAMPRLATTVATPGAPEPARSWAASASRHWRCAAVGRCPLPTRRRWR